MLLETRKYEPLEWWFVIHDYVWDDVELKARLYLSLHVLGIETCLC